MKMPSATPRRSMRPGTSFLPITSGFTRVIVAGVIADALNDLKLAFPKVSTDKRKRARRVRQGLLDESDQEARKAETLDTRGYEACSPVCLRVRMGSSRLPNSNTSSTCSEMLRLPWR
jgi:hypothetical protein